MLRDLLQEVEKVSQTVEYTKTALRGTKKL